MRPSAHGNGEGLAGYYYYYLVVCCVVMVCCVVTGTFFIDPSGMCCPMTVACSSGVLCSLCSHWDFFY